MLTKSELKKAKAGTPGKLTVPLHNPGGVVMGDVIQIKGADPDFHGLLRFWQGSVVEITEDTFTIDGRYWIGNEAALRELVDRLNEEHKITCPT